MPLYYSTPYLRNLGCLVWSMMLSNKTSTTWSLQWYPHFVSTLVLCFATTKTVPYQLQVVFVLLLAVLRGLISRKSVKPDGLKPDGLKPDGLKPDGLKPDGLKPDALIGYR